MQSSLLGLVFRTSALLALTGPSLFGQCKSFEVQKLALPGGIALDAYGRSVSVRGDLALIGANVVNNKGQADVYRWDGTAWQLEQQLVASDGAVADDFGWAVAVDGTTAMVAAYRDDDAGSSSGSVYEFRFDGTQWNEIGKLSRPGAGAGDKFGYSLALSGNLAVVGATYAKQAGTDVGAAYVYRFDGTQWNFEQKLQPNGLDFIDEFGWRCDVDGDVLVVTAVGDDDVLPGSGAAYVYRHDGLQWNLEEKLVSPDATNSDDWFGWAAALDGNTLAVSATNNDGGTFDAGAVYVYHFDGVQWVLDDKLIPSDALTRFGFGWSVAIQGGRLIGGAIVANAGSGAAYYFHHDGSRWVETHRWVNSDAPGTGPWSDAMGNSLDFDGDRAVVGAMFAEGLSQADAGSAYAFDMTDLGLGASRNPLPAGVTATTFTCGGLAGGFTVLLVTDVSGVPVNVILDVGTFDGAGVRALTDTVPPGLSGVTMGLWAVGVTQPGQYDLSNPLTLRFL